MSFLLLEFFSCKDTAQHLHLVCLSVCPSVVKPEFFSVSSLLGQVYTKPVYCTNVHKIILQCKCTQNPFTVQVYTKPVYCASVHKGQTVIVISIVIQKGMYMVGTLLRNIHGWNISEVMLFANHVDCASVCSKLVLQTLCTSEHSKKLDLGLMRSSPRYGLNTAYRLTIRNSARLFHHVLFNMGDLYLVLPALNLSTLNACILIRMQPD